MIFAQYSVLLRRYSGVMHRYSGADRYAVLKV
jgi:hypothetical protein